MEGNELDSVMAKFLWPNQDLAGQWGMNDFRKLQKPWRWQDGPGPEILLPLRIFSLYQGAPVGQKEPSTSHSPQGLEYDKDQYLESRARRTLF